MRYTKQWITGIVGVLGVSSAYALDVIARQEPVQRIDPTLAPFTARATFNTAQAMRDAQARPIRLFPMLSQTLTPGRVQSRVVRLSEIERPLVVIGPDALSAQWLQRYRDRLIDLNPSVLVVNLQQQAQLETLRTLLPLSMVPTPEVPILNSLGIRHYPVLISKNRVEQ